MANNLITWTEQPDGTVRGHYDNAHLFTLEFCRHRDCWSLDWLSGELDYGVRKLEYDYDDLGQDALKAQAAAELEGEGAIAWDDPRSSYYQYKVRTGGFFARPKSDPDTGTPKIYRLTEEVE